MSCNICNSSNSSSIYNRLSTIKKHIKFDCLNGAKLSVLEGAYAKSKMEMCDFSADYEQYSHSSMYLEPNATNREISYNIGTQITFLAIKVKYTDNSSTCCVSSETPYLSYIFETNHNEIRYISEFMILTGNINSRIPKIFLSNPSNIYNANVEIIAATKAVSYDSITKIGDNVISIENLKYTDIRSDINNIIINSLIVRWIDLKFESELGDIEKNNRIVTLHDYVQGTINLIFEDIYNADQAYSLLKWAILDTENNIIDDNLPDDEAPTIVYNTENRDIVLAEFPYESTSNVIDYIGTSGGSIIYKEDLFNYYINNITDNRDNMVYDYNILSIRNIESIYYIDAITELGKYFIEINITDNANNLTNDSFILNVKDLGYPKLILSDLGYELYETYIESTSNIINSIITENSYIFEPENYDIFNITYQSTSSSISYIILNNTPIEIGLRDSLNTYLDFVFDNEQLGNGELVWTENDINLIQTFIVGSVQYNIEYLDYYKISITKI